MHDENYKRIFASPRVIEDLLRGFVPGNWIEEVDFATLRKLSTEYISDELLKRHGDNVWRMRLRSNWLYLLLLVEFQSTDDPLMALRILTYTGLLYQELARNEQLDADGRLPAVLPLVLYNGDEPWQSPLQMGELIAPVGPLLAPYQPAQRYFVLDERRVAADDLPSRNRMSAVVGLEQSRSLSDVARVAEELAAWLPDLQVRRAFADWMRQIVERLVPSGAELPPIRKLEDVSMTLVERAAEWSKEWQKEGIEQGLEQGLEQGREQGLEHERALLCRMTAARFGVATAERLAELLAPITDTERLAEVGDWLVQCDTGADFLARVGAAPAGGSGVAAGNSGGA